MNVHDADELRAQFLKAVAAVSHHSRALIHYRRIKKELQQRLKTLGISYRTKPFAPATPEQLLAVRAKLEAQRTARRARYLSQKARRSVP